GAGILLAVLGLTGARPAASAARRGRAAVLESEHHIRPQSLGADVHARARQGAEETAGAVEVQSRRVHGKARWKQSREAGVLGAEGDVSKVVHLGRLRIAVWYFYVYVH